MILVRSRAALPSLIALSLVVLLCGLSPATAQDYPSRPIRVITVTSAGGTSDIFMRALAGAERAEIEIITAYLPQQMSDVEAGVRRFLRC
jgi:tripartite-type tricarboxylate transporter receptor subunit TctC